MKNCGKVLDNYYIDIHTSGIHKEGEMTRAALKQILILTDHKQLDYACVWTNFDDRDK